MNWGSSATPLSSGDGGRTLLAIDPEDPRPMRDLARTMNCDASYVTAMIDDLEHAGYAVRRPDRTDRRVKFVALTDTGIAALRTVQDGLLALSPQLSRLTVGQRRALALLLLREALIDPPTDDRPR